MSTWCARLERQPTAPVFGNKGMAHRPRKKDGPSPCGTHHSRLGIEFRALQCRTHVGKLEGALQGSKAVGAGVLGVWAEAGGAGLLQPGEEITLGAPYSPSVPSRGHQGDRTRFLIVEQDGRMRHECPYMELESFRLDLRQSFFPMRTVWKWGRLYRVVAQYPSFEVFKIQQDKSLSSEPGHFP